MTAKRFTLTFDDNIIDNLTGITHNVHSGYDVAMDLSGLLNELHEENQDLECKLAEKHQDLTELGLKYGDIIDIKIANEVIDNQRNTIRELSEENEQLKQQNYKLIKLIEDLGHEEMERQMDVILNDS